MGMRVVCVMSRKKEEFLFNGSHKNERAVIKSGRSEDDFEKEGTASAVKKRDAGASL